ncbi:Aste57867_8530 [Aphanomyces stellatus]|uniref:Aste57867_8530 protein n=1 Tax=Aphanomyces stellatus TaxID=120398 RepID=A0A485KKN2_9STRA|nr:hypothetical protein As57867_008498 [Aphanomyces stellatus]VFT85416.1 Aste57867_8530 [Aphanomyces stellatus]
MDVEAQLRAVPEHELLGLITMSPGELGMDLLLYRTPATDQSVLHIAITREFPNVVNKLVQKGVDVNAQDHQGKTPLMLAIEMRSMNIVQMLLDAGSDLGLKCHDGYSALYLAAKTSRLDIARMILPNLKDGGAQDLFTAIAENDADVLSHLVAAGVSPSLKRPDVLQTPALHSAIHSTELLGILLERDHLLVDGKDRQGQTALGVASILGEIASVRLLLQHGASLELKDQRGRTPLHLTAYYDQEEIMELLMGKSADVEVRDDDQRTPLHLVAERGSLRGCQMLSQAKAKLNVFDIHGWSPLHLAASLGHVEMCAYFVREGALLLEWNDAILCRPSSTANAWIAVSPNKLAMIYGELWDIGVPQTRAKYGTLRIRDFEMNTLLHVAAKYVSTVEAEYLFAALQHHGNVPVNSPNCTNKTPAQIASEEPNIQFLRSIGSRDYGNSLQLLTQSTLDRFSECSSTKLLLILNEITEGYCTLGDPTTICISNDSGDTVLHVAIESIKQLPDTAQESLLHGSQWLGSTEFDVALLLDKMNWYGKSPLHFAASVGALGACRALVAHGATVGLGVGPLDERLKVPSTTAMEGWTALNLAVEAGHDEVVLYLMNLPSVFPKDPAAIAHLKQTMSNRRPQLLPLLYQRMQDDMVTSDPISIEATHRAEEFLKQGVKGDRSALVVFRVVLEAELHGVEALKKYACKDLIVRSTGDTLLHIFACDSARIPEITYLLTQEKMSVDTLNIRRKTAFHYACQHRAAPIVAFLLTRGADIRASYRAVRPPPVSSILDMLSVHVYSDTKSQANKVSFAPTHASHQSITNSTSMDFSMPEQWLTPLHVCLSQSMEDLTPDQQQALHTVIEMLLQHPYSIIEPTVAAISPCPPDSTLCCWNSFVFERLLADFPQTLALYLNHFTNTSLWYGSTTRSFHEVKEVCRNLDRMTHLPKLMLHPTIHNALKAKWKLYGRRLYRKELCFSILLVLCFTLSNYTVVTPQDDDDLSSINNVTNVAAWFYFETTDGDVLGVFKILTWLLALYHLIYVELWQELRLQMSSYWRSIWNYINLATYSLLLASLPLECMHVRPAITESCLSLASILLLFGLMQSLLVYPYFSVLLFTFSRMVRVALKFCCLHLILLVGFTAAFYLVFHGKPGHESLPKSMATVFFITFGEIQFHEYYSNVSSPFRYSCGLVVLVSYIICVNLVGLNMLIAMMTSEYEDIKTQAEVLSTQQLAGTMHRYETWLGHKKLDALFDKTGVWSCTESAKVVMDDDTSDATVHDELSSVKAQLSQLSQQLADEEQRHKRESQEVAQRMADIESTLQQQVQANHKLLTNLVHLVQTLKQ